MSKTPTVKASTATTPFSGVNNYNYNVDGVGSANSSKANGAISTNVTPSSGMADQLSSSNNIINTANQTLSKPLDQQYQDINNGNNAYYNSMAAQNALTNQQSMSNATARYSNNGLEDSTARGAFEGQLASGAGVTDLQTRQAAQDYQNQQALSSGAYAGGLQNNIFNYLNQMGQTSNANLNTGFQNVNQNNQFNAGQTQQASSQNAQIALQEQQMRNQLIGNAIGAVGQIGGAIATGGASIPLQAASQAASQAGSSGNAASMGLSGNAAQLYQRAPQMFQNFSM